MISDLIKKLNNMDENTNNNMDENDSKNQNKDTKWKC
jgi:hypothetical protein